MEGSKKLQDVFTDALVPAEKRRTWPVIAIGETVIWLPGLVRSRHLLLEAGGGPVIRLEATAVSYLDSGQWLRRLRTI